ncbi:MAG: glycosyltransferase family 4 protein [Planctomycetes bacterium]|nr:glycosyltransferase family 4 protein [Planctomycetota bacterium]
MRVGLDYRPALHNREGIGRYARELVRGFIELGFDGELGLFGYTAAAMRFSREELGIAGTRAELVRMRLPSRLLPWLLARLGKGVDDLVGGASVYHHTQPNLLAVRNATEVATIFDCIYMIPDSGYLDPAVAERMTAAAKEQVRRAKRILVPSQYVGAEVVLSLGAHPARVAVTELGCDHIARALPPEGFGRAKEPYVLTVSRVDPRKNHLRMLRAFELLVKEGLPHGWIVAGPRGHDWQEFARALERSPARARVQWIVDAPEADLPRLYAQADCLLFASLNEGFGLPPLEAMACGTPVVSSCVTSLPEVCGDAAFLVEPTDHERIFEATRRVLMEREVAAELRTRGLAQSRKFTWRECAKRTLLAYRNALEPDPQEQKLRHVF